MRILTTQFKPTSGNAHIFGLDVVKDDAKVRKIISYVPQEISVWNDIRGTLKKLLVVPASRYTIVTGRSIASGVRAIFQALIILPIAERRDVEEVTSWLD